MKSQSPSPHPPHLTPGVGIDRKYSCSKGVCELSSRKAILKMKVMISRSLGDTSVAFRGETPGAPMKTPTVGSTEVGDKQHEREEDRSTSHNHPFDQNHQPWWQFAEQLAAGIVETFRDPRGGVTCKKLIRTAD